MKTNVFYTSIIALFALCLIGCTEDIDESARYVFKEKTITDYLSSHEEYTEYCKLLKAVPLSFASKTTVWQRLSARGHFTVFAPTNDALQQYLDELAEKEDFLTAPSWDAFVSESKRDSISRIVVLNSIIDNGDENQSYYTYDFPTLEGAEFPLPNMYDHMVPVTVANDADNIYINKDCPINVRNRDILLLNGILHQMEKAVVMSELSARDYLTEMINTKKEGFLVMARAIEACGLLDTLKAVQDERYEQLYQSGKLHYEYTWYDGEHLTIPEHRKFGFTIFAETDDFWRSQGIDPQAEDVLQSVQQWVADNRQYSEGDKFVVDDNYTSEDNLLNQWTTYHILPMRLSPDKLVIHANEYGHTYSNPTVLGVPVEEFYVPFGKRRLLKIYESAESNGVYLNRFPELNNGRRENGHERSCDPDKVGCRVNREDPMAITSDMVNAVIYPISAPLAYTDAVRDNLKKRRLRMDGASWFPELMNNNIRKKQSFAEKDQNVAFPPCDEYQYFDNMWVNDGIEMGYLNNLECGFCQMYEDEFRARGKYDVTIKLPPVPRSGIYEFRSYYHATAAKIRGIAQISLGTSIEKVTPLDIPISWEVSPNDAITGWESDTEDDDYNAEIDKRMRNRGYMKGDNSFTVNGGDYTDRVHNYSIRRIVGRRFLDSEQTYYLRLKSVLDKDEKFFYLDYWELCPKEIYDNPNEPEDIW